MNALCGSYIVVSAECVFRMTEKGLRNARKVFSVPEQKWERAILTFQQVVLHIWLLVFRIGHRFGQTASASWVHCFMP